MPKSGKEIVKILQQNGWRIKSQKGFHVKLEQLGKFLIIPVHGNQDLGRGLIRAIEKQSGVALL